MQSEPIQTRHPTPLPVFGASQAPPGAVVFHRFLQDLNRTPHATALPTGPPNGPHGHPGCPIRREPDCYAPSGAMACQSAPAAQAGQAAGLLPTLGDLPPITPAPALSHVTEVRHIQRSPATGRMIDLLA